MYKIRIHGRGGQGGKAASKILGAALYLEGYEVQDFARYGSERRGAPVEAFVRFDRNPILERGYINDPDCVMVLDESLIGIVDVAAGLKKNGLLIINTPKKPSQFRGFKGFRVVTVDARSIALETVGLPVYNTAMLGAFAKATNLIHFKFVRKALERELGKKLGEKLIEKNMDAVEKTYDVTEVPK
ncbi:MAG: 2-oxoacid:acceptor oxidoreductase family protein [Candidatus Diapherotrites archaeon]|nr:2-oxoacid:acceptor oxidoreductase family protein [Candidatus Diapherotrites archaeon]